MLPSLHSFFLVLLFLNPSRIYLPFLFFLFSLYSSLIYPILLTSALIPFFLSDYFWSFLLRFALYSSRPPSVFTFLILSLLFLPCFTFVLSLVSSHPFTLFRPLSHSHFFSLISFLVFSVLSLLHIWSVCCLSLSLFTFVSLLLPSFLSSVFSH